VDEARRRLREYPDYARYGFGRWGVVYKPDDRVIGFNGLKYLGDLEEVDLGYRFLPEYWGRGIATESSLAIVRYGFESLGLERIIALVLPDNTGSIRVLEKIGMRFERMIDYCCSSAQQWSIESGGSPAAREDGSSGRRIVPGP
jgi:RimJ/RimL family protein N-acetyltransferase